MYIYKLQETDEAKNDLALVAFEAYDYTRDVGPGLRVFQNYEDVSETGLGISSSKGENLSCWWCGNLNN